MFIITVVKPISSVAHLKLNTKPELDDFKIPKLFLTIIFDDISVGLAKVQVQIVATYLFSAYFSILSI